MPAFTMAMSSSLLWACLNSFTYSCRLLNGTNTCMRVGELLLRTGQGVCLAPMIYQGDRTPFWVIIMHRGRSLWYAVCDPPREGECLEESEGTLANQKHLFIQRRWDTAFIGCQEPPHSTLQQPARCACSCQLLGRVPHVAVFQNRAHSQD